MFKNIVTDVFFDLDHTLWDFERNSALAFKKILEKNNVKVTAEDFLEVYSPINFEYWKLYRENKISKDTLRYKRLKSTFDILSLSVEDALIYTLSEEYIAYLPAYNHLFQHTIEILQYLKPNYKLHIITNGFEEVQHQKIQSANISSFFTHIVNSEMVGVKKPNPKIFEFALEKAQVSPDKSVMIGDSLEADILGAKNMGMNTLHFNSHNEAAHNHSKIIHSLSEIKNYL